MKNGHYAGYRMKKTGDQIFYYCSCNPSVSWKDLRFYDLHYEITHMGTPLEKLNSVMDKVKFKR